MRRGPLDVVLDAGALAFGVVLFMRLLVWAAGATWGEGWAFAAIVSGLFSALVLVVVRVMP